MNQRQGEWTRMDWRAVGGEDLRPGALNAGVSTPLLNSAYLQVPGSAIDSAANFAFYPGCTFAAMTASQCLYTDTWSVLQPASEALNVLGSYNAALSNAWDLHLSAAVFNTRNQQVFSPVAIPYPEYFTVIAKRNRRLLVSLL